MPRGALFREERDGATYALVTLFPPVGPEVEADRLPREVVFVIDTSGSMQGHSIEQARKALSLAIDTAASDRPLQRDPVQQLHASRSGTTCGPRRPRIARPRGAGCEGLAANGGTEMAGALQAALVGSDDPSLVRQVVFLTDGGVGNEEQLFGIIRERLGDTRLFTVGIGSAPNSHFMTTAAEFGHGTFTYIGDVREVEEKMTRLFRVGSRARCSRASRSRWPAGAAVEAWPARIPDLYLGEPVVVSARLAGEAERGPVAGRRGEREPGRAAMALAGGRHGGPARRCCGPAARSSRSRTRCTRAPIPRRCARRSWRWASSTTSSRSTRASWPWT